MGFNANSSEKKVVQETKLYTGLTNMKVVAINPSKAEMEALGYRPQADPVYLSDDNNVKKIRVDFYLAHKTVNVRTKVAIWIENRPRISQDGSKAEWINNYGRSAWGTPDAPPDKLKWFDTTTARVAKVGESDLHNFLINWLNIAPTDEAKLDHFDALFTGNLTELKTLLKANSENEIRVLLAVKEGKYPTVYNGYFDRATNKRNTYWESHIKRQAETGYPIKDDFQGSLVFKEWVEPDIKIDKAPVEEAAANTNDPF